MLYVVPPLFRYKIAESSHILIHIRQIATANIIIAILLHIFARHFAFKFLRTLNIANAEILNIMNL